MNFFSVITSNGYINAAFVAHILAQLAKAIIVFLVEKEIDFSRLLGAGGMPSSHSSATCALTFAVARGCGIASVEFAICLVFTVIVMYDAAGVRRAAGEQAAVLNKIIDSWQTADSEIIETELKELLGHTPLQVFFGALLGIIVGLLFPL